MLLVPANAAHAQEAWLDQDPPFPWNFPGQQIPPATPMGQPDPRAVAASRPAEGPDDEALVNLGWHLYTAYQAGWGVKVILATSYYDGMGRPVQYQGFVFVDEQFAGTLSPVSMDSRSDGSVTNVYLFSGDVMNVAFARYTPEAALCCPTATTTLTYSIIRSQDGPVVVVTDSYTQPTAAETIDEG